MKSRSRQNPGEEHWTAVKNILKYLRNTKDMFLVYGDAEYIAAFDTSNEAIWIRKFISGLGIVPTIEEPISMYCDNTGAIAIAKDDGVTKGARHFRVKVHYLRETIKLGDVNIEKIDTDDNLADPSTKALAFPKHSELTRNIKLLPASSFIVYNKRTRVIMESIHVNFDELPQMASANNSSDPAPTCQSMASVQISSDPAPECQTMALEHSSLSPGRICQENVSHGDKTGTTSNELDLLFSPMFDELLNGSTKVVSKSFAVSTADALYQRQQPTTPLNTHRTPAPTCQTPPITPTVISSENITQAEPHAENDEVADDEFINIFSTPVQDQGETSSRHVDSSNMHTFYQRYPSE
nr:hypothetical protein [Tanacetum cinerariifolium]